MDEYKELDKMTDAQLVAYWNILQFSGRMIVAGDDGKIKRHTGIVKTLLLARCIPCRDGKRTVLACR